MKYKVIVIGSGPGGYVAAIRCAQLGMKTALVEKYDTLGGTCLNVGCIPSKAMLDSTEHYHKAREQFGEHGIEVSGIKVNLGQMIKRKNEVVRQTCDGVSFLMKKNKIDVYQGTGSFKNKNVITVTAADNKVTEIDAENVITPGIFVDRIVEIPKDGLGTDRKLKELIYELYEIEPARKLMWG